MDRKSIFKYIVKYAIKEETILPFDRYIVKTPFLKIRDKNIDFIEIDFYPFDEKYDNINNVDVVLSGIVYNIWICDENFYYLLDNFDDEDIDVVYQFLLANKIWHSI